MACVHCPQSNRQRVCNHQVTTTPPSDSQSASAHAHRPVPTGHGPPAACQVPPGSLALASCTVHPVACECGLWSVACELKHLHLRPALGQPPAGARAPPSATCQAPLATRQICLSAPFTPVLTPPDSVDQHQSPLHKTQDTSPQR